ncbi:uncharacterized protein SAMN05192560_1065 [Methylobacillus rhizosphaerae]|uniref:MYND finger n=1 Tax=Methylobacillus rhizosphaerae TaxID=551994 RepID=A0A238Z6G1_9PROT|nr:PP0621 family protein [Methylobacillus rhizosphaerae]SNR78649.1 uncharacterized protein SAMN05192560_1065 [Methylobacillus rhizosphaerae]
MIKLLLLAIVFWLIHMILKRYRANMNHKATATAQPETMVQCAHCRIHLPSSESIQDGERHYCSEAHRQAHHS